MICYIKINNTPKFRIIIRAVSVVKLVGMNFGTPSQRGISCIVGLEEYYIANKMRIFELNTLFIP